MPDGFGSVAASPYSHVVQFYRRDDELTGPVAEYLAGAIAAGGVAIVAATLAHHRLFGERLAELGVDVAAARRDGTLIGVDAADAVGRFAAAGVIDRVRLDTVIGQVVRGAVAHGGPVRVFGEMVTLLWEAGHVNAALELEEQWNALGREMAFSLYCAYPEQSVADAMHADALAAVCGLHESIVTAAIRAFPGNREAPRAARHFVTETLRQWRAESILSDAEIVVTELATNAVIHARSGFTVSLAGLGGTVRISVGDATPLAAANGGPLPVVPTHGLGVVAAVCQAWGIQAGAEGKTVWAELRQH